MLEPLKLALPATANCTFALLKICLQREALVVQAFPSGRGRLAFGSLSQIRTLTGCPCAVSGPRVWLMYGSCLLLLWLLDHNMAKCKAYQREEQDRKDHDCYLRIRLLCSQVSTSRPQNYLTCVFGDC